MEDLNSAFKSIRRLPVIDCYMDIERYVASKWDEIVSKVKRCGVNTFICISQGEKKTLATAAWGEIDVSSTPCFIVAIRKGMGVNLVMFAIQFCDEVVR